MTTKLADSLQDKVLTLGQAGEQFPLADYLRKTYVVLTNDLATGETHDNYFDNSADANAFANLNFGELSVYQVNDLPKAAFWNLWEQFKKEMQAQGVYVTKRDGQFVVTETKPTRSDVVRGKGYGRTGRGERYSTFAGNVKFSY